MVRGLETFRTFLEMVKKDGLGTVALSKELGLVMEISFEAFANQLRKTFGL